MGPRGRSCSSGPEEVTFLPYRGALGLPQGARVCFPRGRLATSQGIFGLPPWLRWQISRLARQETSETQVRSLFNPWVGEIPWRRKWLPTPVFLPGESHGQRSLAGYSLWGPTDSDTTERLTLHFTLKGTFGCHTWRGVLAAPGL